MKALPVTIIGGSGTLGVHVLPILLRYKHISRIRVMSRNEHQQTKAKETIDSDRIDWILGDVRDRDRVKYAIRGCESVFNFAAVKSVDKAEYDAEEAVKTIVDGARNVIWAAKEENVRRCMLTSTDKAVEPHNLYGAAKLTAEKLWISEGNKGDGITRFSVCRYGNVLASQGSVIEIWNRALNQGRSPKITDLNHTRFFIRPKDAAMFVCERWLEMAGGETFIPKMKAIDLARLYGVFMACQESPPKSIEVGMLGVRPGEKTHECLVSKNETSQTTDLGDYFIRWPDSEHFPIARYGRENYVDEYTSQVAERFETDEIMGMVREVLCT